MGNWKKIHGQLEKKLSATFSETMGNVLRGDGQQNPHQGSILSILFLSSCAYIYIYVCAHDDQKQHLIANRAGYTFRQTGAAFLFKEWMKNRKNAYICWIEKV